MRYLKRAGAATKLTKNIRCAAAKKAVVRCARSEIFSPMSELLTKLLFWPKHPTKDIRGFSATSSLGI